MKKKLSLLLGMMVLISTIAPVYAATYKTKQDATAYVNDSETASGKSNEIGYVAVHPKTKGSHSNPIIPFGTYLYIDKVVDSDGNVFDSVYSPEGELTAVRVQDIGDVNYKLSTYFVDFYFGTDEDSAEAFGLCKVDYHY
jgi:hypothetical protein